MILLKTEDRNGISGRLIAAYLETTDGDPRTKTSFIHGKSKVAPRHGHTIPRLEFCAAVLSYRDMTNYQSAARCFT